MIKKSILYSFFLFFGTYWASAQTVEKDTLYQDKIEKVQNYIRVGDIQQALGELENIMTQFPQNPEPYFIKSKFMMQGGMINYAVELAKTAYQLKPDNLQYGENLAFLYRVGNKLDSALLINEDLLRQNPKNLNLYLNKMSWKATLNQYEGAYQAYDDAAKSIGKSDSLDVVKAEILNLDKKFDEAIELLNQYRVKKSKIPNTYAALANAYINKSDSKTAEKILLEGVENTKFNSLYIELAQLYLNKNNLSGAKEALKKIFADSNISPQERIRIMEQVSYPNSGLTLHDKIELADLIMHEIPYSAELHAIKGDLLWLQNDLEEAKIYYLRATEISPNYEDAWRKIITLKLEQKDADRAISLGLQAISLNPNSPKLLYFTGLAYFIIDDKDNAKIMLEAALNSSENESTFIKSAIYSSLGDLYHSLGNTKLSNVAYEEAIKLDSTNATALNNLAYYSTERNDNLDQAEAYAKKAVELQPNSGTFMDTYAWTLFRQGKYAESKKWIEKAIKHSSESSVLYSHYGDILFHLGKKKQAVKQWKKALELTEKLETKNIEEVEKIKRKINEGKYIE